MNINGIEIKPGMVLVGRSINNKNLIISLIAYSTKFGIKFVNAIEGGCDSYYDNFISELLYIHDISNGNFINDGKILWHK